MSHYYSHETPLTSFAIRDLGVVQRKIAADVRFERITREEGEKT